MVKEAPGLEFPCAFPVKVMVENGPSSRREVLDLAARHASFSRSRDVRYRASRNGRFESITINIRAESRQQLEALYRALNDLDVVKMML